VLTGSALERFRLASFTARETARGIARFIGSSWRAVYPSVGRGAFERVVVAPQDLRTTDPTVAADIYAGYFAFAGKAVATNGRSPFEIAPPNRQWAEELMGFSWLRHLRAAETALSRANARALVEDWLSFCGRGGGLAWETGIVARRLIAWVTQSPLILDGADRAFYRRFMRSIARQASHLGRSLASSPCPERRLQGAIALCYVALSTQGTAQQLRRTSKLLANELDRQILPDGGHVSRNPAVLLELLADLLPLRQLYASQGVTPPQELLNTIDRVGPMLRLFRHGDGSLALFNGMGRTPTDLVATVLAYQDIRAQAIENAAPSGYQRAQGGSALVIMDAGAPPADLWSGQAHAGCLSFEYSDGPHRLIVNCGAPGPGHDQWLAMARSTAAHSTLSIADRSSCRFAPQASVAWPRGAPIVSGPRHVAMRRTADGGQTTLVARHDGYLTLAGVAHERMLTLIDQDGTLIGEDRLITLSPRRARRADDGVTIRFHLHPAIEAGRMADTGQILLRAADGKSWMFESPDCPAILEDSVVFATPDGGRRTTQIVLATGFRTQPIIRWSLARFDLATYEDKTRHSPQ
jgi:uncharacterized heparinase superfamily protein